MTHDLLCPHRPAPPEEYSSIEAAVPCQCGLINKVRADTLDKALDAVEETWGGQDYPPSLLTLLSAIDALRGES